MMSVYGNGRRSSILGQRRHAKRQMFVLCAPVWAFFAWTLFGASALWRFAFAWPTTPASARLCVRMAPVTPSLDIKHNLLTRNILEPTRASADGAANADQGNPMSDASASNRDIILGLALRVPVYAAINVAVIQGMFALGALFSRPTFFRIAGLAWIAFFSSWASGIVDMREMLLAVARGQLAMPSMAPNAGWYEKLRMPSWTPPGWLFPIMWLLVSKPTQVAACSRIVTVTTSPWPLISLWVLHLSLGDAWNEVFFGRMRLGLGAAVIGIFYSSLLLTTLVFARVDRLAGLFMLPTCLWVTVATSLSLSIYALNK